MYLQNKKHIISSNDCRKAYKKTGDSSSKIYGTGKSKIV
jgi:hypothetical protein